MKIATVYTPAFLKQLKRLSPDLQEEAIEKIALFQDSENHRQLKVHKLLGHLDDCYGFSVNYKIRIVFEYLTKNKALLLSIGDHDIYR